jgi:hypothetical protein
MHAILRGLLVLLLPALGAASAPAPAVASSNGVPLRLDLGGGVELDPSNAVVNPQGPSRKVPTSGKSVRKSSNVWKN